MTVDAIFFILCLVIYSAGDNANLVQEFPEEFWFNKG
jgi:hypothetical protein